MKKSKFRLWLILTLLWTALIFVQSAMPARVSKAESGGILAFLQNFFPWLTHNLLRKLGHFGEFAVLGICLTGLFYRSGKFALYKPLALGLLVALCDETLQLFVEGRSGEVRDIWIDFSGVIAGTLFLWLIFYLGRKKKKLF